jgi:Uri superfamily endonuclease
MGQGVPGIYRLIVMLGRCHRLTVGKLGTFVFDKGVYLYTGSALGGLDVRVGRHLRQAKRLRWHIDYLLTVAPVVEVQALVTTDHVECEWARHALNYPTAVVPVLGFGATDCGCPAHLLFFGDTKPELPDGWVTLYQV